MRKDLNGQHWYAKRTKWLYAQKHNEKNDE